MASETREGYGPAAERVSAPGAAVARAVVAGRAVAGPAEARGAAAGPAGAGRDTHLEGLGICSLVIGAAAVVVFFLPDLNRVAWMPGVVAIVIGALDLQLKVSRRRYAILGMMLGVTAFSWSFAMMLFGSAT